MGDFGFKEVQTKLYHTLNDEASQEYASEPESCSDDDLQGTGLNVDGKTSTETSEQENVQNQNSEQDQNQNEDHKETLDVKPMVRHLITFSSSQNEPIVISDSDEEEPKDVKPFIKAHVKIHVDANAAIVVSDDEEAIEDQNNRAVCPLAKKILRKYHHIKHDHTYACYLCGETFEMQSSFVNHFRAQHPNDAFKCEFCPSLFRSSNGLFKHERSHLYMKYKCDTCYRFFQFPYQLKIHTVQHTGIGHHQCTQCTRTFGSKCSRVFHERSHNVQIKCDLCPMSCTKIYNNQVAVNQHKRGMHGPGWTTTCGENYKWKSRYQLHNKSDCKKCIQNKAQRKLDRFSFLRKMDLTQEAE